MDTAKNKQLKQESGHAPGRIVIDGRGRNVWQWSDDQLDSTTIMLQRLDNSALALEPTRSVRRPAIGQDSGEGKADGADAARSRDRRSRTGDSRSGTKGSGRFDIEHTFKVKAGGGFDPYNNG